jgi:hypothetical protein
MKEVPLSPSIHGQMSAWVDDEEIGRIGEHCWSVHKCGKTFYAVSRIDGELIDMHVFLFGKGNDHKNRNGLDNRRVNLRPANRSQNGANRGLLSSNASGYKGVSWFKGTNKWRTQIVVQGKRISLGLHDNVLDAARAYNKAALRYFGEFACLNVIASSGGAA